VASVAAPVAVVSADLAAAARAVAAQVGGGNIEVMKAHSCESCLMPFNKDPGTRESEKYCSLCFKDGRLMYEGNDVKEFQNIVYKSMRSRGENIVWAWLASSMVRFAPRWKK
jgi:hypothetical protein